MLEYIMELVQEKNNTVNHINFALLELNKLLNNYTAEHSEIVNFAYEPTLPDNKIIIYDYPTILISLPPFKATITYESIISRLEGTLRSTDIISVVLGLLRDQLIS